MRSPNASTISPWRSCSWCAITRSSTRSARRSLSGWTARSGPPERSHTTIGKEGRGCYAPAPSPCPIYPRLWTMKSPNIAAESCKPPFYGIRSPHGTLQRVSVDPRGTTTIHMRRTDDPGGPNQAASVGRVVPHGQRRVRGRAARVRRHDRPQAQGVPEHLAPPLRSAPVEAPAGCKHGSGRGRHEGSREEGGTVKIDALIEWVPGAEASALPTSIQPGAWKR